MYLEIDNILAELKNRLANEKSLKNKLLLEKAIDALSEYNKQIVLKH